MDDKAELYDLLHSGNPGDVEHYLAVCQGAATVLELGSGAGRIARKLASRGHAVTGLEIDAAMVERAKREAKRLLSPDALSRLELVHGDMRAFDLGRTFDRIILPYNGLYCLGGIRGALECLEAAARHLAQAGELWLDAYAVDAFHAEAPQDDEEDDEPVAELEVRGETLRAFERSVWDREDQRLDVTYSLKNSASDLVAVESIVHHYLLGTEVVLLLDEAGFEVTSCRGGFSGEPFDDDASTLVVGARLRGEVTDES